MTAVSVQSDLLEANAVRHGFFGRCGGKSTGIYASLNCGLGSGDNEATILANRSTAAVSLGANPTNLSTLRQVHGSKVIALDRPTRPDERPQADGVVTNRPGIMVGILTADCAPILLFDPSNRIIGAAHAGWKGTLANIVGKTINAMVGLGAQKSSIRAVIGPCIARESYEVGPEIRQSFVDADKSFASLFCESKRPGHQYFDLGEAVRRCLEEEHIAEIGRINRDTYRLTRDYFSYRRNTHHGIQEYGRQLSAIMLVDNAKP